MDALLASQSVDKSEIYFYHPNFYGKLFLLPKFPEFVWNWIIWLCFHLLFLASFWFALLFTIINLISKRIALHVSFINGLQLKKLFLVGPVNQQTYIFISYSFEGGIDKEDIILCFMKHFLSQINSSQQNSSHVIVIHPFDSYKVSFVCFLESVSKRLM